MRSLAAVLFLCSILVSALAPVALAGQTPPPWVARHGLSSAAYQNAFDDFGKQGFQLVSVSGYVVGGEVQYAALWRKSPGGEPWAARHGLSFADFQKTIDDLAKDDLHLVYVDGYEVDGMPLFAGIWRKGAGAAPVVKLGMDGTQYQAEFDALHKQGYRLEHVAGYTHHGAAVYAAIWDKAAGPEFVARHGLTSAQYQQAFDDFAKQGFRLKEVSGYSPGGVDHYAAIWEKGGDGAPWIARHGIPLADYQTQFDIDRFQGWQPHYVQAFTSGGSARFDVIYESPFSPKDLGALQAQLSQAAQHAGVAGLSIAITRGGHLLYAMGVGLADREAGIPMNVHHRLRVGSVSKTISSVAIFRLIQSGATYGGGLHLTLDSPVFGPQGILPDLAVPPLLAPLKDAKLRHFLEHTAGLPGGKSGKLEVPDPVNCAAGNLIHRISFQLEQIGQIKATDPGGPVPREPGTEFDYSNIDYAIVQAIIERVSGTSYQQYVLSHVFNPAAITAPRLFHIGPYDPTTGEAKHYLVNGNYAEYAAANTCDNLPPNVGAGGWAMSAKDLIRYLTSVDGLPSPPDVLSVTERTAMLHRPIDDNPSDTALDGRYARGWITVNWGACNSGWNIVQGHNGGLSGAFSNMYFLQEGEFSFVVIGNQDPTSAGTCQPSADPGKSNPPPVPCGGTGQPFCGDEASARVIDLIRRIDWPNYDLF
jgi:CubicO group peptidase (beta-lactamase class C family)